MVQEFEDRRTPPHIRHHRKGGRRAGNANVSNKYTPAVRKSREKLLFLYIEILCIFNLTLFPYCTIFRREALQLVLVCLQRLDSYSKDTKTQFLVVAQVRNRELSTCILCFFQLLLGNVALK